MEKTPVGFERVASAFAEGGRMRLCESSGSEHSPENSLDLSDLVNSFIERDDGVESEQEKEGNDDVEKNSGSSDSETVESLRSLLGSDENEGDHHVRRKIKAGVKYASQLVDDPPASPGFKRKLMARLRERGFDAGLCKSKWEKLGRFPAGNYEYVDVNAGGERYIVHVCLAREFEIARPTAEFSSLLELFPPVFVGKVEDLKLVARVMCAAIKASLKSKGMHVPPWRRNGYVQAKWFGSYKRTTNQAQAKQQSDQSSHVSGGTRSVGFELQPISFNCRHAFAGHGAHRVGYLTAAFNGDCTQR